MITVVIGDIARIDADAVLRPSSENLAPVTAVATHLDAAAGPKGATSHPMGDRLDIGAAVVTTGGNLAPRFVIHLVITTEAHPVARRTIERALVSAWQRADDWALSSIASPPLGVGAGLDFHEAVEILIASFQDHVRHAKNGYPKTLLLVVDDEEQRAQVNAMIGVTSS